MSAVVDRAAPSAGAAVEPLRLDDALLIYHVADVKRRLLAAFDTLDEGDALTLDCTALAEFDGAGLQLLVETARSLRQRGARLCLAGLSAPMVELLRFSGFAGGFDLNEDAR